MEIQNLSEDIILAELHREPQLEGELQTAFDIANDRGDCDVILDFSKVDIITSSSLAKLLKLRQFLADSDHRLIFCSINSFTKSAFKITGLDGIFELADDKFAATEKLQNIKSK